MTAKKKQQRRKVRKNNAGLDKTIEAFIAIRRDLEDPDEFRFSLDGGNSWGEYLDDYFWDGKTGDELCGLFFSQHFLIERKPKQDVVPYTPSQAANVLLGHDIVSPCGHAHSVVALTERGIHLETTDRATFVSYADLVKEEWSHVDQTPCGVVKG